MNIIGLASSFAIINGLIFSLAGSPSSTFGSSTLSLLFLPLEKQLL